ncbi:MAG: glutamate 5-kinase, partial [Planctomycetota bacterium]|nr:glutamate 5-kinase [Planctomycetota bacterium]
MQVREKQLRTSLTRNAGKIVVKVGSRLLSRQGRVDVQRIQQLSQQISSLANDGRQVSLVSSGAVGTAMTLLDSDRPTGLGLLQAYAAIGQAELIQQYNREFEKHGKRAAQVLLTIDDMDDRQRYLNLRNTFISLFELGAIPVINENDCVATEEISVTFGDNDRLAANVAMLVDADLLIILSDVDALYDRNPCEADACRIGWVEQLDDRTRKAAVDPGGEERSFSKGGMSSKMEAAAMAASVGIPTLIAGGHVPDILEKIMAGEEQGT